MAAAFQPAAGVDRLFAAQFGGAGFGKGPAFAHGAEPHGFGLVQFPVSGGIVQFGQADVLGSYPGHIIGLFHQTLTDIFAVQIPVRAGAEHRGPDFYGAGGRNFFR